MLLSIFSSGNSYAGTWRNSFDEGLKEWIRTAEHNAWNARWETVEGMLFSEIRKPRDRPRCENNAADFLQWKAIQFQLEQLTVIGTKINYTQEGPRGMGELCLFLGNRQPEAAFAVKGYIFSPEETSGVTFSIKDDYSRGKTKATYENKFPLTTHHLKVIFNSGLFKVYTNEVLLTQFTDASITQIDVVGLLVTCH